MRLSKAGKPKRIDRPYAPGDRDLGQSPWDSTVGGWATMPPIFSLTFWFTTNRSTRRWLLPCIGRSAGHLQVHSSIGISKSLREGTVLVNNLKIVYT